MPSGQLVGSTLSPRSLHRNSPLLLRRMRLLYRSSLMLLASCASAGNSTSAEIPAAACENPPTSTQRWKQVSTEAFAFCVPSAWRLTTRNTYRGEGGWIRWGTGPRPTRRAVGSVTVVVPAGQKPPMPGRQRRFTESIGGGLAEMWDNELQGTYYTGAEWRSPAMAYIYGQSTSLSVRDKQLEVYRTMRFASK